MSSIDYIKLFKIFGALFVISTGFLIGNIFTKNKAEKSNLLRSVTVVLAVLCFIGMLVTVIGNANTVAPNPESAYKSDIYNIIFYTLTFLLRATIFGIMVGLFIYLIKKSLPYPKTTAFILHKALLALGILGILIVFVYDVKLAVEDRKYAEIISFGKYGIIFIGSMFWMMLCSVLAAAALPEDKKNF